LDLAEMARRSGFTTDELGRLVELEVLRPDGEGRFDDRQLRCAGLVRGLTAAGIQLEGLGAAVRDGTVSFAFLSAPAFERFSALGGETFAEVAQRTGVPVELLQYIREAQGSVPPEPDDRMRVDELVCAELVETAFLSGFRPAVLQHLISSQGDNLRRVAETEAAIWDEEVLLPAVRAGRRPDEILGGDFGDRMSAVLDRAIVAMYHLQQTRAWTAGIIDQLEVQLAEAGLHSRLSHPPAMCFLDISGYTRLTQERGDAAAAELAASLSRVVQKTAPRHGGRPVKWLGDGVMLHFPVPGEAVAGALDMVRAVAAADLPPAHVGLHAGPVIFQEGDYYGSTVNLASRIADHAGPGQVLVSQAVMNATSRSDLTFSEIGAVELKGVTGAMPLFEAFLA
jgi:adenylate cyclase